MWAAVLRAWHELFPPPPTPREAAKAKIAELRAAQRDLDRRTRRGEHRRATLLRTMKAYIHQQRTSEAKQTARLIAASEKADRQRLQHSRQLQAMATQIEGTVDDMELQIAFVEATRLMDRFNRAVPGTLMEKAGKVYMMQREAMRLKTSTVSERLDEEAEEDLDAIDEEDADTDTAANKIYEDAMTAAGLELKETMPTVPPAKKKAAAAAEDEKADAEALADIELASRLGALNK